MIELSTLKPGQTIRVQMGKKWVKAKVEEQVDIRSYRLRTEDGKQYRRNRKHLRTTQENWSEQPTNHEKHNTGDRILRRINDTNGVGNGDTAQKEIKQNTGRSVPTKETETTLDTVNKPAEQQNDDRPIPNKEHNNNNNNCIQRRYSRFFTISSQRRKLSPTRTPKWPGRNKSRATHRALITCKCHGTCHLVRRDSSAIKFDRVEIAFI